MVEDQEAGPGLGGQLRQLRGRRVVPRGIGLEVRSPAQPLLRLDLVDQDVTAVTGLDRGRRGVGVARDDDAAARSQAAAAAQRRADAEAAAAQRRAEAEARRQREAEAAAQRKADREEKKKGK